MSSSETSGQLNPGSKAYLYSYLQNTNWYKAQLQSLSGPLASLGAPAQDLPQQAPQSTTRAQDSGPPQNRGRPRITGQIANVDQQNRSFSIQTERGDLTLKLPRTAPLPPEGLRIEIELPRNKGGAPPREGQNIAFRPLPQNSQPAPIRQKISDAAPLPPQNGNTARPVPEDGMPVPPFKPSTPLVDTPQAQQVSSKEFLPTAPKLENGAVIIVRTMSAAQIQTIRSLPLPAPEQVAPPAPQHTPSTTQTTVNAADQTAKPAVTIPQPNPTIAGFRLNIPAPNQTPAMQPELITFFTNTEKAAAILRGTSVQTITAAPEITINPATPETASRPAGTIPQSPVTDTTITTAATTTKTAPAQTRAASSAPIESTPAPQSPAPQAIKIETATLPQVSNAQANTPVTGERQAASASNVQRGEIVGQTEHGRPVMAVRAEANASSSVRYFALDMPATNIAQGTQVSFTETAAPQNIQPTIPQAAAIAAQAKSITFSPHATWPALDDIAQTLQMTAPNQAQALMNQSPNVQSPAMKMEPAILFFLAAARSGDIAGWLGGKSTEALRQAGKSDTLNRIMNDFRSLSRPSQDSGAPTQTTPEWRSMPLPLFAYNEAHKIMLHYKYDGSAQQNDGESDKNAMRFVIDLEMTKMGDVQLDGFAQKERLDLIVRTRQPLSPEMQQIMRRKYSGSLEATGFHGELGFHGNPDKFIKIEPATATDLSGINV